MNCGKKVRNKRIRTAEGVVGHAEEGKAIGSKYVEDVGVLREAEPGVGLRRQLLQDPPSHRPRVPRHRAEHRQHHRSLPHTVSPSLSPNPKFRDRSRSLSLIGSSSLSCVSNEHIWRYRRVHAGCLV